MSEPESLEEAVKRVRRDARLAVFHFIESCYNPRRRHSALGYRSPNNYEKMYFADSGNQPVAVH